MEKRDVIIVGGGPCGLSAAIALQDKGFQPLIIEKGNVVNAVYNYPTHQTFFSSSEKLEIGNVPFIIEQRKPSRNQALAYYREVVRRKNLSLNTYEKVIKIKKMNVTQFLVTTTKQTYECEHIVIATGYYDNPNYIGVPGENLPKVFHYFKEAHPYFDCNVVIVGGKNSAVDAALELHKAGASSITVLYRGENYSEKIKPWILPEFESLVRHSKITMEFKATIKEIKENEVIYIDDHHIEKIIPNDFVFAMTGYKPDHDFLQTMGIGVDEITGRPLYDPQTMETNVKNVFIAGVIAAGNNANEIFIENGRFHGELIANTIAQKN
ncbi:YpdA family putative bacillithiol disulfide reductase [Bacillus sp. Marseille-P3661]|uniref:YpdA family putative bacillithiol disulfide reductase n=1 Tax=Bacillus sp. Marseille-P3661 TaxID=1936234 RepID=UPI000C83265D|nr:YpdA family putative bacillithiol disulfide reductase [Bacillus sp. Marseille-P3661]